MEGLGGSISSRITDTIDCIALDFWRVPDLGDDVRVSLLTYKKLGGFTWNVPHYCLTAAPWIADPSPGLPPRLYYCSGSSTTTGWSWRSSELTNIILN